MLKKLGGRIIFPSVAAKVSKKERKKELKTCARERCLSKKNSREKCAETPIVVSYDYVASWAERQSRP